MPFKLLKSSTFASYLLSNRLEPLILHRTFLCLGLQSSLLSDSATVPYRTCQTLPSRSLEWLKEHFQFTHPFPCLSMLALSPAAFHSELKIEFFKLSYCSCTILQPLLPMTSYIETCWLLSLSLHEFWPGTKIDQTPWVLKTWFGIVLVYKLVFLLRLLCGVEDFGVLLYHSVASHWPQNTWRSSVCPFWARMDGAISNDLYGLYNRSQWVQRTKWASCRTLWMILKN